MSDLFPGSAEKIWVQNSFITPLSASKNLSQQLAFVRFIVALNESALNLNFPEIRENGEDNASSPALTSFHFNVFQRTIWYA